MSCVKVWVCWCRCGGSGRYRPISVLYVTILSLPNNATQCCTLHIIEGCPTIIWYSMALSKQYTHDWPRWRPIQCTPCWKWQISSFQPAPTIIALNWANERRVCVRLSQPMTVKRKHRCDDMCWKLQDSCRFEQGVFSLFLPSELSSLWADCTIQWKFMLIQTGSQPSHLLASIIKNYHQLTHHHHNKSIKQCLVKMKPKKLWASWVVLVMLICTYRWRGHTILPWSQLASHVKSNRSHFLLILYFYAFCISTVICYF